MASARSLLLAAACLLSLSLAAQRTYKLKRFRIPPAHYSGIAPLDGGRYAVVSDEEAQAGFYVWSIQMDSVTGRVLSVAGEGFRGVPYGEDRDAEGVAHCSERGTLFVSGEADQRIVEHRLDGTMTGCELAVPSEYGPDRIRPNRGFEALGYDEARKEFWTCPESALPGADSLTVPLLCFGSDLQLRRTVPYPIHPQRARSAGRSHYHGVVAITPLPDGRLLLLEREARIARRYSGSRCWCRLYRFDPQTGHKELVEKWTTRLSPTNSRFSNYEGMCLGPRLRDGRPTLLLVADSQGGYGRALWHLRDRLKVILLDHE